MSSKTLTLALGRRMAGEKRALWRELGEGLNVVFEKYLSLRF